MAGSTPRKAVQNFLKPIQLALSCVTDTQISTGGDYGATTTAHAWVVAGGEPFSPMPGRPMREYVAMPPEVAADVDAMRRWIERAAEHVRTLPSKAPKTPKKAKGR